MAVKRPLCIVLTRRSTPTPEELELAETYSKFDVKFRTSGYVQSVEPNVACYAGRTHPVYEAAGIPRAENYKVPEKTRAKTRAPGKGAAKDAKPPANRTPAPTQAQVPGAGDAQAPQAPQAPATWGGAGKQ